MGFVRFLLKQVLVRIRPVNSTESGCVENFTKCLNQESAHSVTWLGQPESQRFTFDHVAGEKITQVCEFFSPLCEALKCSCDL